MFGQTFRFSDFGAIGFLVVLEALLSADNALVLAIMVRPLPHDQQKKALLYGLGGAFVLRTASIILAAYIINFWWLQGLGALYLLYLPAKHFISHASNRTPQTVNRPFWATVIYLNIVDTAFALDSVIVAVAVVDTVTHPDKLWVVVAGATIGIVILRFAASYFIRLLEHYPLLDHVAYLLVGWAGVKLAFITGHSFQIWHDRHYSPPLGWTVHEMPPWLFWAGMALIAVGGGFTAMRHGKHKAMDSEDDQVIDAVYRHERDR